MGNGYDGLETKQAPNSTEYPTPNVYIIPLSYVLK